jgi:hypothetical protein
MAIREEGRAIMLGNVPNGHRYPWKLIGTVVCAVLCVGCPQPAEVVFGLSVERNFDSPEELELIEIAESIYPAREDVLAVYEVEYIGEPPDGDLWWYTEYEVRIPYAITTEAIDYYSDVILQLREDHPDPVGPFVPGSFFSYTASVAFYETYENEGQTFTDVYVVTMEFDWGDGLFFLSGGGFQKMRVVVLTPDGEPLGIFGDGGDETTRFIVV